MVDRLEKDETAILYDALNCRIGKYANLMRNTMPDQVTDAMLDSFESLIKKLNTSLEYRGKNNFDILQNKLKEIPRYNKASAPIHQFI